jgi:hypothetical protein
MDAFTKVTWFSTAVLIEVVQNFALYLYLRRAGVKVSFALAGTPGYLDNLYRTLRSGQNKSSFLVILLRMLSLVNVVVAAIYFIASFR